MLLQRARPTRFGRFHDELVFAAGRISAEPRPAQNFHAVFQIKLHRPIAVLAKINRPDLAFVVFQREIDVSGLGAAQVGHLTFHPEQAEGFLQEGFNMIVQL